MFYQRLYKALFIFICFLFFECGVKAQTISICQGDSAVLRMNCGYVGTLQWQKSVDQITWTDIIGEIWDTVKVTPSSGNTYYRSVITNGTCQPIYSDTVTIAANMYWNSIQSGTFIKNDCGSCQTGTSVTYTVNANTYSSCVNQSQADSLATYDLTTNGQQFANSNGTCSGGGSPNCFCNGFPIGTVIRCGTGFDPNTCCGTCSTWTYTGDDPGCSSEWAACGSGPGSCCNGGFGSGCNVGSGCHMWQRTL